MKNKICSPYYDSKASKNPYLSFSPTKESSKLKEGKKAATVEEKTEYQKKLKRSISENGFGDTISGNDIDHRGNVSDFSDYHHLKSANKSCQVSFLAKRKLGPQRVSSHNFFPLSQVMNKTWVDRWRIT